MEQCGVAAVAQIVQRQAGDLIAATIIDAFERAADHGTGRRGDSTQVQVVPLQIVCFGMVLDKAREIIGVFDQERLCLGAKALQCYLIDSHRVVTVVEAVFGHDSDRLGLHVLKAQGICVFHVSPFAERKARYKLGQIIRTDRPLDRDL